MRDFARHFQDRIILRNGSASMAYNNNYLGTAKDRMEAWLDFMGTLEHLLPDMDLAMNIMDESRIIAPWESVNKYIKKEGQTRKLLPRDQVISQY
jgi:hypothetical protein